MMRIGGSNMKYCLPFVLLALVLPSQLSRAEHLPLPESMSRVTAIAPEVREKLKLDPYYEKQTDYQGYLILASNR